MNKRKWFAYGGALMALLSIVVLVIQIYTVNDKYPSPKIYEYEKGEAYSNQSFTMTYIGNHVEPLTYLYTKHNQEIPAEIISAFGESNLASLNIMYVQVSITNTSSKSLKLPSYIYQIENTDWSQSISSDLYRLCNQSDSLSISLEAGETKQVYLPYILEEQYFSENEWMNMDNIPFRLVLSVYPDKNYFSITQ